MRSRRARLILLGAGAIAAAIPALAYQPESLLPPGFGDPKAPPPPDKQQPQPTPTPAPPSPDGTPLPPSPVPPPAAERVEPVTPEETTDSAIEDLALLPPPPTGPLFDLPPAEVRPTDIVGVIGIANRGLPIDAFGDASGPFLTTLVARLDAPLPSRWASILLRRALMSRVASPVGVNPADWVAARTELLLRMGEADAARMLSQAVDVANYTPAMVRASFNASLASADPAGLCPLVDAGDALSDDPVWPMAAAMCAGMAGEQARAGSLIDQARRRGATGVDLLLAEKVIGAAADTRRAVAIDWDPVTELNPWRLGLAGATGSTPPERLLNISGPRSMAWLARAPMIPIGERLAAAEMAAAMGVFSSDSLVDVHALALDMSEADNPSETPSGRLQAAYAGATAAERLAALRALWGDGEEDPQRRYARLILTAGAAARVEPDDDLAADMDAIVGAMFAAGMDAEAARWAELVEGGGAASRAWALLAVGAPRPLVSVDSGRVDDFAGTDASRSEHRSRLLVAALLGLGRVDAGTAQDLGFVPGPGDDWSAALERAAARSQPGTVALLAAVGLQSPDWRGVPAEHLYRIVAALSRVGLEFEARMIAAEALTRL